MRPVSLGLLLALAVPVVTAPAAAEAARRDWSTTVTATPQGTYVLGSPAAKVKLVEYLSFTCSHCARFTTEGFPALKSRYIATGQVSFEIRNAVRDRYDLVATLLSRCQGARGVFAATEALMARQGTWMQRAGDFETREGGRLGGLSLGEALPLMAEGAGMQAILATRGLSPVQARKCLSDPAALDRVRAIANEAWHTRKIEGTPSFLLNGASLAGAASWDKIEPLIIQALK